MQLASEAKRDEVLAISIRGEPNQKSYQKEKEIHKNQERKNKKNNKIMTKNKKKSKKKKKKKKEFGFSSPGQNVHLLSLPYS